MFIREETLKALTPPDHDLAWHCAAGAGGAACLPGTGGRRLPPSLPPPTSLAPLPPSTAPALSAAAAAAAGGAGRRSHRAPTRFCLPLSSPCARVRWRGVASVGRGVGNGPQRRRHHHDSGNRNPRALLPTARWARFGSQGASYSGRRSSSSMFQTPCTRKTMSTFMMVMLCGRPIPLRGRRSLDSFLFHPSVPAPSPSSTLFPNAALSAQRVPRWDVQGPVAR